MSKILPVTSSFLGDTRRFSFSENSHAVQKLLMEGWRRSAGLRGRSFLYSLLALTIYYVFQRMSLVALSNQHTHTRELFWLFRIVTILYLSSVWAGFIEQGLEHLDFPSRRHKTRQRIRRSLFVVIVMIVDSLFLRFIYSLLNLPPAFTSSHPTWVYFSCFATIYTSITLLFSSIVIGDLIQRDIGVIATVLGVFRSAIRYPLFYLMLFVSFALAFAIGILPLGIGLFWVFPWLQISFVLILSELVRTHPTKLSHLSPPPNPRY